MDDRARQAYLETQLMTATPQKLRLMLIEGALRLARQTIEHWQQGDHGAGVQSLSRCRGIIAELLASIRPEASAVARDVSRIYWFVYRTLLSAQLERSAERVQDVIKVLEVEQQTWQLLCQRLPGRPAASPSAPAEISASQAAQITGANPPAGSKGHGTLMIDA